MSLSVLVAMLLAGQGAYAQVELLTSIDIGTAANNPGSTEIDLATGTSTVIGSGHDIWGNADGFRFVYTTLPISGDFSVAVRIVSFERVDKWAKAGLIARQSLEPGAKNALSTAAAGVADEPLGVQLTWREETDGETQELNFWELGGPSGFNDGEWVRLARQGDDFSVSWSEDGATWADDYATVTIQMDDPILVGLAVTSCDEGLLCQAVFENLLVNNVPILMEG
ncbi:MAG: hypothetical protein H8D67_27020, partial [Deltaproteobacteria bacterium]|nr:hypothetical protein [Deltaproteobacteria bacterium]